MTVAKGSPPSGTGDLSSPPSGMGDLSSPPSGIGDRIRFWLSCLGPLVLLLPKVKIIWLSNISILSVPDESYPRNVSCALNLYLMKVIPETCRAH